MLRSPRTVTALSIVIAVVASGSVRAQTPKDYYSSDERTKKELAVVEQYHYGKGMQRMESHEWPLAMAEWDFILRYFPNHPRALFLMQSSALKGNMVEQAEGYFKNAMRLFPNTATTYSVYGILLYNEKKYDESIKAYQDSLSLDPKSAETHYNLGVAYAAANNGVEANRHAQAAYSLGYPLPGLRDQLKRKGAWKPLPSDELATLVSQAQ